MTLRAASGTARLTVADDGGGFDPGEARRAGGVGLASIEERAQLLGGRCRIASAPGAGSAIEVTVPLPAAKGAVSQLRELVRRHRGLVAAAALVILALAAGLVTTLSRRGARESGPGPPGDPVLGGIPFPRPRCRWRREKGRALERARPGLPTDG